MNITRTCAYFVLLCTLHIMQPTTAGWFSSHKYEQEELLELTPQKKQSSFTIDHELPGSIHIKGWHQDHIAVTIHKKMQTSDNADRAHCTLTQTPQGVISLQVKSAEPIHKHDAIDLTIHMPHHMPTTVALRENIIIEHVTNTMHVRTDHGNVTTQKTRGAIHLETKQGDITITDAFGAISAYTDRGAIMIEESHNSITAETLRGSVVATCATIPTTASITLTSDRKGIITLTVPESTEARLIADTTRGMITSDMLVTLERHTTLLNTHAYKDAHQHIRGVIGQNGAAEIRLTSAGNIHITPAEIA